jgi:NADPH:quinone reductase-like Zn-dependent oxidoreductase
MATCLGEGGVIVSYGSMSGEDPVMPRHVLGNAGVTLAGFTLGRGLAKRSAAEVRAIYADLGGQVLRGKLSAPVEKVYPIEEIRAAVAHAQQGERTGKILVKP